MPKINAYIGFNDTCRQAMAFYREVIGGELTLQVVKESPMKDMFPGSHQDMILHASLESSDFTLLATDLPGNSSVSPGTITLMLTYETKAEMKSAFDKLAEGGNVTHPIMEFFAGTMGNLTDKFGVKWGVFSAEK
ncbi:VOC family protein [Mucilaginibacter sp. ZT4R22]|uniref:VOC family protein n=1 Tax=Mucilaginibacter pankratovii TaxID=2772110 RepID=A0ABR7WQR7_9SPHI|nr:VOC family protein [Mucilaginibacter pankratovii]MBD1363679.1 VOC family protein [Mucilaginibacter pankratovii]